MAEMGRPKKYNGETVEKAFHYLENFHKYDDLIPSAAGLGVFLGVAKSTVYKWAEENEDFSDVLRLINSAQEKILLRGGLSGDMNAAITKLVLSKHDYSDKVDSKTDITTNGKDIQTIERVVVKAPD